MSEKKNEQKPEDLTSEDLDKAVGGAIMHDDRAKASENEGKVQLKEEKAK